MCKTHKYFIFTSPVILAVLADHKKGGRGVFMEGEGRGSAAAGEHKARGAWRNHSGARLPGFSGSELCQGGTPWELGPEWIKIRDHQWFLNFILKSTADTKLWASWTDTACRCYPPFWWCMGCSCKVPAFLHGVNHLLGLQEGIPVHKILWEPCEMLYFYDSSYPHPLLPRL